MTNGDIMEFTSKHPEVNRLRLVYHISPFLPRSLDAETLMKLAEVASGLKYLHSMGIIHGDLNPVCPTKNFLVSR
jgi:serine/threonine protein kinase